MTDNPNDNNDKSKAKSKADTNFEAKLRGKLKRGLGSLSLDDPPQQLEPAASSSSSSTATDTVQPQNDVHMQDASQPQPQPQPQPPNIWGGIDLDEIAKSYDENKYDVQPFDEFEGEEADSDGYHDYSKTYTGPGMIHFNTVIMHNPDDPEWLSKVFRVKKLPGVYSPEGYIWGRTRKEVFYMEVMPGVRKSGSLSIVYALDQKHFAFHKVKADGTSESEMDFDGSCDNPNILKALCGEPKPHFEMLYNTAPWRLEMGGPEQLDTYIPPSKLPRWLYVYDEDDVTHSTFSEPCRTEEVDWNAGAGHPVLPIPDNIKPFKYRLIDPTDTNISPDEEPVDPEKHHATLILSKSRTIHASTGCEQYEAQICLQDENPGPNQYPSRLRVAAKLDNLYHPEYLKNEATMYNLFPDYFSREYTGVQLVEPSVIPRRLSRVVPCFYGYYQHVPEEVVDIKGKGKEQSSETQANEAVEVVEDADEEHENAGEEQDNDTEEKPKPRRSILLTEYCGSYINPQELTQYQKLEIVSLLDRFHNAGFLLGSISRRHFLFQPGPPERCEPLCRTPKWARTSKRPSFRIDNFDYADWCGLDSMREKVKREYRYKDISELVQHEKQVLKDKILLRMF